MGGRLPWEQAPLAQYQDQPCLYPPCGEWQAFLLLQWHSVSLHDVLIFSVTAPGQPWPSFLSVSPLPSPSLDYAACWLHYKRETAVAGDPVRL